MPRTGASQQCVEAARERTSKTLVISKPVVIIVEGMDEIGFFCAMLEHLGLSNRAQVICCFGKDQLRGKLGALLNQSGFMDTVKSIGIVRDADANPQSAFESVCSTLRACKLSIPDQQVQRENGSPDTTILITPSARPGMMEDLCLESIAERPHIPCIMTFEESLIKAGLTIPNNSAKATMHAFLSMQNEPGKRLGEAALSGYWDLNHMAFEQIRKFLLMVV